MDVGLEGGFTADLILGYEFILYWLYRNSENFWVLNPNVYGEVASSFYFGIKLYFI